MEEKESYASIVLLRTGTWGTYETIPIAAYFSAKPNFNYYDLQDKYRYLVNNGAFLLAGLYLDTSKLEQNEKIIISYKSKKNGYVSNIKKEPIYPAKLKKDYKADIVPYFKSDDLTELSNFIIDAIKNNIFTKVE